MQMGYNRRDAEDSLRDMRYDDIFATYLLLQRIKRASSEDNNESVGGSSTKSQSQHIPSSMLRHDTTPGPILPAATNAAIASNFGPPSGRVQRALSTVTQPTQTRRPSNEPQPPVNGNAATARKTGPSKLDVHSADCISILNISICFNNKVCIFYLIFQFFL